MAINCIASAVSYHKNFEIWKLGKYFTSFIILNVPGAGFIYLSYLFTLSVRDDQVLISEKLKTEEEKKEPEK